MENLERVLAAYTDIPMGDGDVVLVTDREVVQEVTGLADHWDPVLRANIAYVLRELDVTELVVAVARRGARALPGDDALWADLREELLGSPVVVAPLVVLPAA